MKRLKAFTLVELMVVMAIISFLSVGAYAGLTFALRQGRDTQRRRIVDQIQTAFIAYYSDFSEYPGCNYSGSAFRPGNAIVWTFGGENLTPIIGGDFKSCGEAFSSNANSLLVQEAPAGISDYFEGDFKWGPFTETSTAEELLYYYDQKSSNKAGRSFTVCAALENPRDNCYCVGAEQSTIACAGLKDIAND